MFEFQASPWDLCCTKRQWDRFLPRVLRFYPVGIIPPIRHVDLHWHVALTRRTNGQSLVTFKKEKLFCKSRRIGCKFIFNRLQWLEGRRRGSALQYPTVIREILMLGKPTCLSIRVRANFKSIFHTEQTCKWRDLCWHNFICWRFSFKVTDTPAS